MIDPNLGCIILGTNFPWILGKLSTGLFSWLDVILLIFPTLLQSGKSLPLLFVCSTTNYVPCFVGPTLPALIINDVIHSTCGSPANMSQKVVSELYGADLKCCCHCQMLLIKSNSISRTRPIHLALRSEVWRSVNPSSSSSTDLAQLTSLLVLAQ